MSCSIVIPVYNGAETIGPLVDRLFEILGPAGIDVVLVNDGSPDDSDRVCRLIRKRYPSRVTYVQLSKNFGEHNAVMAGLHQAQGDYVVIMDDDFQNPPEEVARLVRHAMDHDYDVVYSRYAVKKHSFLRNLGSRFNDRVASVLLSKPKGLYLSSFKCLNRFTVREVIRYSGPYPYIDGLILRSTRNIGTLEVRHDARQNGRSNYTLRKLIRLWLNMFVNFSVLPLRVATVMGLMFSVLGVLLGLAALAERIRNPEMPLGWASLLITVVTFSGVQLIMLGVLGEYLGRLFLSGNQTPQFVIRETSVGETVPCPTPPTFAPLAASASSSPVDWDFSVATSHSDWLTSTRG